MNAEKKNQVEKLAVIALLAVFGLTFSSALKNFGIGRPRPVTAPSAASEAAPARRVEPVALAAALESAPTTVTPTATSHEPSRSALAPSATASAYSAHDVRDPLKSLLPAPPSPSGQAVVTAARPAPIESWQAREVQGVIWGGSEPKAIIDQEVYGVGDLLDGATIVAIDRSGVRLRRGDREIVYAVSSVE